MNYAIRPPLLDPRTDGVVRLRRIGCRVRYQTEAD